MTESEYYWEKAEFQDPVAHRAHVENYKKGIHSSVAFDEQYAEEARRELEMEKTMKINEINSEIEKLVAANDGYCPCAIEKTPDTKCMCKDFREQEKPGPCYCGRFEKVEK